MSALDTADRPSISDRDYRMICEFLFGEAQLLDAARYGDWLALMDDDIRYRLTGPTVQMWKTGAEGMAREVLLLDETRGSLGTRVKQLMTAPFTVSENPRSFTTRFVTNITIAPAENGNIAARSNVLIFRSRDTQPQPTFFAVAREDVLICGEEGLRLRTRNARLSEATISARNIATLF